MSARIYSVEMIEVDVHRQLLHLQRQETPFNPWPHQLTMGRLVARALHHGRSTLVQVSGSGEHRLSYLLPALTSSQSILLCLPEAIRTQVLEVELPLLRRYLPGDKPVECGNRWPSPDWQGVYISDPSVFLADRLQGGTAFPRKIPVLFDCAHGLEQWATDCLKQHIFPADWDRLEPSDALLTWRARLTRSLLEQPQNRLTFAPSQETALAKLLDPLSLDQQWQAFADQLLQTDTLRTVEFYRASNQFSLLSTPIDMAPFLKERLWPHQPVVIIGEALDPDRQAKTFRQRLGLGEMTCLRFPPDPREEEVVLYLPPKLLDLTSPVGQQELPAVIENLIAHAEGSLVILLNEGFLRQSLATELAALYGSRVSVDTLRNQNNSIHLCSWEFWERQQNSVETPQILVVCSLPFANLDDPLIKARIALCKQQRRDWFRSYLLPIMLGRLQRGLSPLRRTQGLVALVDSRVNSRSYGQQLLDSLTPSRRLRYLE
jgi:ATP-dependent DNA helicase DinG